MNPKNAIGFAILILAALGILVAFQLWTVGAAIVLIVAALVVREVVVSERVQKLESRISLVQTITEERAESVSKTLGELSDAINFLRGELSRVVANVESRVSAVEQRLQADAQVWSAQKYYDLVQKVIEIENRISALAKREGETNEI
jgi:hypothetical protein